MRRTLAATDCLPTCREHRAGRRAATQTRLRLSGFALFYCYVRRPAGRQPLATSARNQGRPHPHPRVVPPPLPASRSPTNQQHPCHGNTTGHPRQSRSPRTKPGHPTRLRQRRPSLLCAARPADAPTSERRFRGKDCGGCPSDPASRGSSCGSRSHRASAAGRATPEEPR